MMKHDLISKHKLATLSTALAFGLAAMAGSAFAVDMKVVLSGDQEVPAVKTAAKGNGFFAGSLTTTGIVGTAAHIHEGGAGKNGPVMIPLTKNGDTYSVPAGTKLSDAQKAAFDAGNLYVNVHSAANPGGELRAQMMKP